jgi:hypothetical protein
MTWRRLGLMSVTMAVLAGRAWAFSYSGTITNEAGYSGLITIGPPLKPAPHNTTDFVLNSLFRCLGPGCFSHRGTYTESSTGGRVFVFTRRGEHVMACGYDRLDSGDDCSKTTTLACRTVVGGPTTTAKLVLVRHDLKCLYSRPML